MRHARRYGYRNGKHYLIAWTQTKCRVCQRFLKKRNGGKNICHTCFLKTLKGKIRKEYMTNYRNTHKKEIKGYRKRLTWGYD